MTMSWFSKKDKEEDSCIEILRVEPGQAKEFLKDLQAAHDKMIEEEEREQGKEERRKK